MPEHDAPLTPPEAPATCEACTKSDHDTCHTTALGEDAQLQPCSCPCGGGLGAWVAPWGKSQ